jgi:outer membrane protein assembly factor BamB
VSFCIACVVLSLFGCSANAGVDTPQKSDTSKSQEVDSQKSEATTENSKTEPASKPAETATSPAIAKLSPITATSWPSFRNGDQQLGVAGSTLPEKPELLWKYPTTDGVVATAAIVGEYAYVPELSGYLRCFELATGKLIWSYRSLDDPDPDKFAWGFKAAPTVTADTIYAGAEDGTMHAIDRATGKMKWQIKSESEVEITGGVAVVNDRLLFGSHDGNLYCYKTADHALDWKFHTEAQVYSSPAISDHFTFLTGCDEHLRVIDINTGKQQSDMPMGAYIAASPAVMGDILYVGTAASEVVAVDWKNQQVVWKYSNENSEFPYHASAAVTDKFVLVGCRDKNLHCINRETGKGVWKFATRGRVDSSPVVVGDRVFFGSADRNLYAVNLQSGEQSWKYNTKGEISSGPAVGEGYLVVGSEGSKGEILCFGTKQ